MKALQDINHQVKNLLLFISKAQGIPDWQWLFTLFVVFGFTVASTPVRAGMGKSLAAAQAYFFLDEEFESLQQRLREDGDVQKYLGNLFSPQAVNERKGMHVFNKATDEDQKRNFIIAYERVEKDHNNHAVRELLFEPRSTIFIESAYKGKTERYKRANKRLSQTVSISRDKVDFPSFDTLLARVKGNEEFIFAPIMGPKIREFLVTIETALHDDSLGFSSLAQTMKDNKQKRRQDLSPFPNAMKIKRRDRTIQTLDTGHADMVLVYPLEPKKAESRFHYLVDMIQTETVITETVSLAFKVRRFSVQAKEKLVAEDSGRFKLVTGRNSAEIVFGIDSSSTPEPFVELRGGQEGGKDADTEVVSIAKIGVIQAGDFKERNIIPQEVSAERWMSLKEKVKQDDDLKHDDEKPVELPVDALAEKPVQQPKEPPVEEPASPLTTAKQPVNLLAEKSEEPDATPAEKTEVSHPDSDDEFHDAYTKVTNIPAHAESSSSSETDSSGTFHYARNRRYDASGNELYTDYESGTEPTEPELSTRSEFFRLNMEPTRFYVHEVDEGFRADLNGLIKARTTAKDQLSAYLTNSWDDVVKYKGKMFFAETMYQVALLLGIEDAVSAIVEQSCVNKFRYKIPHEVKEVKEVDDADDSNQQTLMRLTGKKKKHKKGNIPPLHSMFSLIRTYTYMEMDHRVQQLRDFAQGVLVNNRNAGAQANTLHSQTERIPSSAPAQTNESALPSGLSAELDLNHNEERLVLAEQVLVIDLNKMTELESEPSPPPEPEISDSFLSDDIGDYLWDTLEDGLANPRKAAYVMAMAMDLLDADGYFYSIHEREMAAVRAKKNLRPGDD